jgi:phenylacetate-CoA oxygenase PaaJ subunit
MDTEEKKIWQILETVPDPEIPVLTIHDLGILRGVSLTDDEVEVIITPTYTGCPAMDMIAMNIKLALIENGYSKIKITSVLAPAWTTDWMSEAGKIKLKEYGIAPPHSRSDASSDHVLNAPNATLQIQDVSVSLAAPPAKHYTNATIVKSRLIILSAIKKIYSSFTLNLPEFMLADAPVVLKAVPRNVPVTILVAWL